VTRSKLPRVRWLIKPATRVVPNKKALQAKRACRKKAGPYPANILSAIWTKALTPTGNDSSLIVNLG